MRRALGKNAESAGTRPQPEIHRVDRDRDRTAQAKSRAPRTAGMARGRNGTDRSGRK